MEMMLRSERSERGHTMHMDPRTLLAMGRMARLAFRHGRLPRHQAALLARRQATLESYRGRDWSETPLPELLAQLDELVDIPQQLLLAVLRQHDGHGRAQRASAALGRAVDQ
jgi:hypothetical protein